MAHLRAPCGASHISEISFVHSVITTDQPSWCELLLITLALTDYLWWLKCWWLEIYSFTAFWLMEELLMNMVIIFIMRDYWKAQFGEGKRIQVEEDCFLADSLQEIKPSRNYFLPHRHLIWYPWGDSGQVHHFLRFLQIHIYTSQSTNPGKSKGWIDFIFNKTYFIVNSWHL